MTAVRLSARRSAAGTFLVAEANETSTVEPTGVAVSQADRSLREPGNPNSFRAVGGCGIGFDDLWRAVSLVPDPELGGVTIGELGLVHDLRESPGDGAIEVILLPTFLGCPALNLMQRDVIAVLSAHGVSAARVTWAHSPTWSPRRISEQGRVKLAELGIAVPGSDRSADGTLPVCPICGIAALEAKLPVGPTACRSVAWCTSCRSVVEIMRGSIPDVSVQHEAAPRTRGVSEIGRADFPKDSYANV